MSKKISRIKVTNNWENLYWHIDDVDVTAALTKITLEFPDKTTHSFKVTWSSHYERYYNMGRMDSSLQYNAFIILEAHGLKLKTNLDDIAKRVKVIDYKVKRP